MRRQDQHTHSGQPGRKGRGSIVLYLILGLAAFGILAAAGAGRFGASVQSTHSPNCATQARYMAESGVRYAATYLRAAASQADLLTRIAALNSHGEYVVDAARGLKFDLSVGLGGTGQAQVNATGAACGGSVPSALSSPQISQTVTVSSLSPGTGDVSLSNPADDFFKTTDLANDSPIKIVGNSIVFGRLDQYGNAAAIWYAGNATAGCVNGNCTMNAGFRAYFEVQWDAASQADGLVFGVISAETNTVNNVGGDTTMGELMGWGGGGPASMNGYGLRPPKIGLELDTWRNLGNLPVYQADSRADKDFVNTNQNTGNRDSDHLAYVFWGGTTPLSAVGSILHPEVYDDNRHAADATGNAGGGTASEPISFNDIDGAGSGRYGYYYVPGQDSWLRNGSKYRIRYELTRFSTLSTASTNCYMLKTWVRSTAMPFAYGDTTNDYTTTLPDMQRVIYLTPALHAQLAHVFFGWTEATGAATQTITASNFFLTFKTAEPTYTVPAGFVAGWPMYENTGTAVHDISANANTGAINGTPRWVPGIASPNGSAVYFGGSTNIQVPDSNSLDLSTQGTISCWFNLDTDTPGNMGLVHKGGGTNGSDAYSLRFDGTGHPQLVLRKSAPGSTVVTVTSSVAPTRGRWYHVAATWVSGGNLTIYVNGVQTGQVGGGFTPRNTANSLQIGSRATNGNYFIGAIDEVYLYNTALSAAQIATLAAGAP